MSRRPPCPDPGNYIWIYSKEGGYWRKKRGTDKKAKLNPVLAENARLMEICSPISKRLIRTLHNYLVDLQPWRLNSTFNGIFITSMKEQGDIQLRYLQDFDFQPSHPFEQLLQSPVLVDLKKDKITLTIDLEFNPVKRLNKLVTEFYFEMIMLYGDISKGMQITSIDSDYYAFGIKRKEKSILSMKLPKGQPWLVLLKVNCLEEDEKAKNPRHFAMKVIRTSN